jgi:hypothetical protein
MSARSQSNPWIGVNYIPNDIAVAPPPPYFLQRIYDFDNMLVLMPSKLVPFAYVIARRRQFGQGLTDKAIEDSITVSDTRTCFQHGLVPVCLMYRTGDRWDADPIIRSLKARDMWSFEGKTSEERANTISDMLEAQEEAENKRQLDTIRDELWHRSGDGYRAYKYRTGQRSGRGGTAAQAGRRISNSPDSGSTAGSGAVFTNE